MGVGVAVRMGVVGVLVGEAVSVGVSVGVGVGVDGVQALKQIAIASHAAACAVRFIVYVSRCEGITARVEVGVEREDNRRTPLK